MKPKDYKKKKKQSKEEKNRFHAGINPGDTVIILKKAICEEPRLPEDAIEEEILRKRKEGREKIIKILTESLCDYLEGTLLGRSDRNNCYTIEVEISPNTRVKGIFRKQEFSEKPAQ